MCAVGEILTTAFRWTGGLGGWLYKTVISCYPATGQAMGCRVSNRNAVGAGGTQDIHVMVGVGPKTSAISIGAGDTQRFQLRYIAATIDWS